jgi:hypothetical protein
MSGKLASGVTSTDRAALESLVAMGDTSVPGIEMSDLNDGDIMANTRERVNNAGQFQFVYIPPDGTDPIESDWIQQDFKKKVILGWCEGVKSAIIGRGQAGMAAANAAAMEAKLKAKREEDMTDEIGEAQTVIAAPAHIPRDVRPDRSSSQVSRGTAPAISEDPTAYIGNQVEIARERLIAAEAAQQDIIREVLVARREYERWTKLALALGGNSGSDDSHRGGDIGSTNIPRTSGTDISRATDRALRFTERTKSGI